MEEKKNKGKERHKIYCDLSFHGSLVLLIIPKGRLHYFNCMMRKWKFGEVKSLAQVHPEMKQHLNQDLL